MKFNEFLNKIDHLKTSQLAGQNAQFKLAPKLRLKYNQQKILAKNPRKAAVLALLYPNENNETTILLTQRASYKGTHSAQISFPGGKVEISDVNIAETALRETEEEVGIDKNEVTLIRELTDVYIPPSNFLATPFIGFTQEKPSFNLNQEVDKIIEVLLSDLLDDNNVNEIIINNSYMTNEPVPCFKLNNYIVWGATGMMLGEIKEMLS